MAGLVGSASEFVWGPFLLVPLLFLVGAYLTSVLGGIQFRRLFYGLWLAFFKRHESSKTEGDISHYQALSVALAATVGVGNIAGVATALTLGGPGALFWMWITGLLGMATKYSEALLGVKYRVSNAAGEKSGGPQQYLTRGMRDLTYMGESTKKRLGSILGISFAGFAVVASFGIGNATQANAVAETVTGHWEGIAPSTVGVVLMIVAGLVILGGIKWIGRITSLFVPAMIVLYIGGTLTVLVLNVDQLGGALGDVFRSAFSTSSAVGGFAGVGIMMAIRYGVARGIFSNESGLGTGGIAAASAKTDAPARQATVSMTQTFIDTIIVVSLTGLTILVSGVFGDTAENADGEQELISGAELTRNAFEATLGTTGSLLVTVAVAMFAMSTIFGWAYYGEKCLERFTSGDHVKLVYRTAFTIMVFIGCVANLSTIWAISDVFNGLMALPNLIGLLLLSPIIAKETKQFFSRPDWRLLPTDAAAPK
ncbi:alanine/glycine:cation symporter family protein [Salininema proteolyticum]|uniref:Alanine/glycine:cation symporter family protein n=1 Tax=Salininema proteolyticum TaxID=1607685 RepID=A0ABV8U3J7_9ACTN